MSKYKVGDELIVITDPNKESAKLQELTKLSLEDKFAQISWGIKIENVEYDKPYVTLTYKNLSGQIQKVFAECKDVKNFDHEKVLEKALLKAFQNEIINISVIRNNNIKL
ncbi:MAG: hypothetical protein PUE01_03880 [Clostridiaceae bacterium]|nr:hypothetical protein [Clostridiaceae bacterium]